MKNSLNKDIRGIALLQALMVTAVVGAAAGIIMSQMRLTETTLQVPRIRSDMLIAESAFRNWAYMNGTYVGGATGGASSVTINASANLFLAGFESRLNNLCTPPAVCQIQFLPAASATYVAGNKYDFDIGSRTMRTKITYTGANIRVKDIDISIVVPDHILTGAPFRCATLNLGRPFFRGFNVATGEPICTGWPAHQVADGALCPVGQVMTDINNQTMQITCRDITAAPNFNCGGATNQYISNISWGNNTNGVNTYTCVGRPNPFTYYGF